jgi:hypothetical protein
MEFRPLLAMLDGLPEIRIVVDGLLERKARTDERIPIAREPVLDAWLETEWARLKAAAGSLPNSLDSAGKPAPETLDRLFRTMVGG